MSKVRVLFFLFLICLVHSCLDPAQVNGQCTKCIATQILQNGSCFTKLRGCLVQQSSQCTQCQNGYILSKSECQRQAQINNITSLNPAPQKIDTPGNLNSSSLVNNNVGPIVGGYSQLKNLTSPMYLAAKTYLFAQYPQLTNLSIYKVEEQIVNGANYRLHIVDYTTMNLYQAKVYVTLGQVATVQELYFNDVSIMNTQTQDLEKQVPVPGALPEFNNFTDPRYIEALGLLFASFQKLDTYKLERVEIQTAAGVNFWFYYNNQGLNERFYAKVFKPFLGQTRVARTWGLTPLDAIKKHTQTQEPVASGQYQTLSQGDYAFQPFLSVRKAILKVFPTFSNELIKKVQQQVVAGFNDIVTFTLPNFPDVFQAKIFVPLPYTQPQPSIIYIKKNNLPYDPLTKVQQSWQSDPVFVYLYEFFKSQVAVSNLPAIQQVNTEQKTISNSSVGYVEYRIIYSQTEKAVVRHYVGYNLFEVMSYAVDGIEMYHPKASVANYLRSQADLVEVIIKHDPKFNRLLVQNITQLQLSDKLMLYQVTGTVKSGSFLFSIIDNSNLSLLLTQSLSPSTCFPIPTQQIIQFRQQNIIDQIHTFLNNQYSLTSYDLTLATVKAYDNDTSQYVMLLAREDLRKIKIVVEESAEKYVIRKISVIEDGYYLIKNNASIKNLQQTSRKLYLTQLQGMDYLVALTNGSSFIAKFANDYLMATFTNSTLNDSHSLILTKLATPSICSAYKVINNQTQCEKCLEKRDIIWKGRCYGKIQNCTVQLGSECGVCDRGSFAVAGKCIKDCEGVFA